MFFHEVLFVDLKTGLCSEKNTDQLQTLIRRSLPEGEIQLRTCVDLSAESAHFKPDLILFRPPALELFLKTLDSMRERWGQTPILGLICTKWNSLSEAYQFLAESVDDFLSCPFNEIDLIPRMKRLLKRKQDRTPDITEKPDASTLRAAKKDFHLESLVGKSDCFTRVLQHVPLLARSDSPVLITGETGTGKELFARAIHYHSPREGKPFIPVNCGALPDHLFENELFGHAKGAFTDASSEEKGLIAEAEGGTLLLDEVDTLSPAAQVKLLRFLQDREYRLVGSSKIRVADVRILAATNADLASQVEAKRFRGDLYYRLNVLSLSLPPLRERLSDIPILADHFLMKFGRHYRKGPLQFFPGVLQELLAYSWPGNVRELEAVIERGVVLARSSTLDKGDFSLSVSQTPTMKSGSLREAKTKAIHQFEKTYLSNLLLSHHGNITRAAESAGKKRQTLQKLLRKYGLERDAFHH